MTKQLNQTGANNAVRDDLITRQQLAELTGVSKSKIFNITTTKCLNFPDPVGTLGRNDAWDKKEVMKWLEDNDPKADILPSMALNDRKGRTSAIDNDMARTFITRKQGATA